MKTLSMIFAILLVAVVANAQSTFNAPVTATASFDCMVITPITVSQPAAVTLVDVIAGQNRTGLSVPVSFTVAGQAGYNVAVTNVGTVLTDNGVTLNGGWAGALSTFPTPVGTFNVVYTINGIDATGTSATGTRTFTLAVNASYVGL